MFRAFKTLSELESLAAAFVSGRHGPRCNRGMRRLTSAPHGLDLLLVRARVRSQRLPANFEAAGPDFQLYIHLFLAAQLTRATWKNESFRRIPWPSPLSNPVGTADRRFLRDCGLAEEIQSLASRGYSTQADWCFLKPTCG